MFLDIAAKALAQLAERERRKPLCHEVALLSRQSRKPSRDFSLLAGELEKRLGKDAVIMDTCESELGSKLKFAESMKRQLGIAAQSRIVVLDGYNPAVCIPPKSPRTTVVQLWHSSGAVKKFGYQSIDTPAGRSSSYAHAAHMHENYDAIIAAGQGAVGAYAEAFGYGPADVHVLGMPHLDYLLDESADSKRMVRREQLAAEYPFLEDSGKVIVYAPTLRKGAQYSGWETQYLESLAKALEAQDPSGTAQLVFAGHPLDHDFNAGLLHAHPCIKTCPSAETVDLLGFADCAITDYSSIALEAGLMGCNVCFYVPDLAEYEKSPGLNINLRDPGTCFASEDAAAVIRETLKDEAPGFDAWRSYTACYFEGLQPGSTERIADFIVGLL